MGKKYKSGATDVGEKRSLVFCGREGRRGGRQLKNLENVDSSTDVDFHEPECCFYYTKSIWKPMGTSQGEGGGRGGGGE